MKKFNIFFFPALFYISIFIHGEITGTQNIFQMCVMVNFLCMFLAAVLMQKNSVWGAYLGIAYCVVYSAADYVQHMITQSWAAYIPIYYICAPLAVYYMFCLVYIKDKIKTNKR